MADFALPIGSVVATIPRMGTEGSTFVHHTSGMALRNTTALNTLQLLRDIADGMAGWPMQGLRVWVRYTRGAEFSGTCYDIEGRIFVNIGRRVSYPYDMGTNAARAVSGRGEWQRDIYTVRIADAYQLALFIFLHECYHWLVRRADRNTRQKEAMCDRFALRVLVDQYGCAVHDSDGRPTPRDSWDFQDLDGFVAAARTPA